LPFDPFTAEAVNAALRDLGNRVRTLVMSPLSDPLPPFRQVRDEAVRVAVVALEKGLDFVVMTRGRFPRRLIDVLAAHHQQARVALGVIGLNKPLVRTLEPRAASPRGRIRDVARLVRAGVQVEIRLEPLIPGLTDTREILAPLFRALADAGATKVVAHYLFLHPAIVESLGQALEPLNLNESLHDAFEGGPTLSVGSLGTVRNLPRDTRREGLARVMSWGAEFGLAVTTGAAQNPDLPRVEPAQNPPATRTPPAPRSRLTRAAQAVS
jgi:hypothetical protein